MPEGDTIYRTARTLRKALDGAEVVDFSTRVPQLRGIGERRLVGEHVREVESRGKQLLIWFTPSGLALHTHMRMTGSWHVYRSGQRWQRPAAQARVVIGTDEWVAVCFNAPVCEILSAQQVQRHPSLRGLGPDALADGVDVAEARRRLDARASVAIAEALLDQRVLAGVGNVYKSEVLFLHGVDPWAKVGDVPVDVRDAILASAIRLLRANVAPGTSARITTVDRAGAGPRNYVYGRGGRRCLRCSTPVAVRAQGEQARLTYWCPRCQPTGATGVTEAVA